MLLRELLLFIFHYSSFVTIISLVKIESSECYLDPDNYMPATRVRACLNGLGSTGTRPIEYIETIPYDNDDYLDNLCNLIPNPKQATTNYLYDKVRTEAQPDANICPNNATVEDCPMAFMYPSSCNIQPLTLPGDGCENGPDNPNYKGFYCLGMYK